MDSLLLLCARRIIAHRPLPAVPSRLYPVLFHAAFQDGRPLVLQDLVSTWPFPELNFQRLVENHEPLEYHLYELCIQAVIEAVATQLKQDLEEPGRDSRCRLHVLDMTGLCDDWTTSPSSVALATACLEVSKHQQEFQRRGSKHHKGPCGVGMAAAAPRPQGVDVHADLFINGNFDGFVRDALLTGAASLLRLKFREFHAKEFTASEIVSLLQSLDPSCVRRVHLCYYQLPELSVILPHLSRFPELRSLKLESSDIDVRHLTPELASGIQCLSRPLGMLPSLRELDLEFSTFSVNLHQILCDLQAPLESLELASCYVLPSDLAYLSQSFHARALKKLNLKDHRLSQSLLEPLQQLLEASSASLLDLELEYCCLADSHLNTLLPTIQRCSRLRFLLLYGNPLSIAALKNLLQKTLELPDLRLVVYPLPVDCSNQDPLWDDDLIDRIVDERLTDLSAEISQMLVNSGRTDLVWTYDLDDNQRTAMDYFSL